MKARVINFNSGTIGKAYRNQDYNLVVMGFNGAEKVKYSKELSGETTKLKDLADYSETSEKTLVAAFDTDNYGIIKHSAGVFDDGKLLGISDMTVAYSDSPYMPGAHGKLYDTACGKIAVAVRTFQIVRRLRCGNRDCRQKRRIERNKHRSSARLFLPARLSYSARMQRQNLRIER